jgi:carbonic anhydrase
MKIKSLSVPFVFVLLTFLLAGAPAFAAEDCSWSYDGATSPEHWAEICAPRNATCAAGTRQSPIDLPAAPVGDLPHLSFHYQLTPLKVKNNGHTIEVEVEPGSYVRIGTERFNLAQFHFHTPSEHQLQGQSFPMELHFVHKNALGEIAVVGVFLQEGAANPLLQEIWDHIPGVEHVVSESEEASIQPEDLLPADKAYYRYAGSLTTPPCTEGVRWHVMHEPIEVSAAQIEEFRSIFPLNARPLQLLNERPVLTRP